MSCVWNGNQFFVGGRGEFKESLAVGKWNDLIFLTMDDDEWRIYFFEMTIVWESIAQENGDVGDGLIGAKKWRYKKYGIMVFLRCEPASGARAYRLSD